jgi:predicted AAA+ superfamily ATPase
MIPREQYTNRLLSMRDTDYIKILTGVRRSGKSSILQLLKEALLDMGVDEDHIIEVNFEKYEFDHLQESGAFHSFVSTRIKDGSTHYLLIDEVQEMDAWAKHINSVRVSWPVDIYVTGSNARMFIGEHLTYITGRYVLMEVFPLSFAEFLTFSEFYEGRNYLAEQYDEYLRIGSFPAVSLTKDNQIREMLNSGLFDSIFARDIMLRGNIRNEGVFMKVAKFVFEHIGSQLSANSIANALKSEGHSITVDTVDNYLSLMCNAYVLYQCERYDIRGKQRLKTNGKYYIVDPGLRNRLLGFRSFDQGHILENIIFLELRRCGFEVYVGKNGSYEVDFMASKQGSLHYIQVSLSVMDAAVLERELRSLRSIRDNYPRWLLTMDQLDYSQDGIRHIKLFDFLLDPSIIN